MDEKTEIEKQEILAEGAFCEPSQDSMDKALEAAEAVGAVILDDLDQALQETRQDPEQVAKDMIKNLEDIQKMCSELDRSNKDLLDQVIRLEDKVQDSEQSIRFLKAAASAAMLALWEIQKGPNEANCRNAQKALRDIRQSTALEVVLVDGKPVLNLP